MIPENNVLLVIYPLAFNCFLRKVFRLSLDPLVEIVVLSHFILPAIFRLVDYPKLEVTIRRKELALFVVLENNDKILNLQKWFTAFNFLCQLPCPKKSREGG